MGPPRHNGCLLFRQGIREVKFFVFLMTPQLYLGYIGQAFHGQ